MNTLTPKEKTEQALAAYLKASLSAHSSPVVRAVPVTHGHAAPAKKLPAVIVYGEIAREQPGLEGCGVFEVRVKVFVLTHAHDEKIANQQQRAAAVRDAFYDVAALKAAVNVSVGGDERAVRGFHLYDLAEWDEDEGRAAEHYGDVLSFKAKMQPRDGMKS